MTDVGKIVFLNNTSGNNFKKNNKISKLSKYNYLYTNLWIIKEVENEDYFKLIHLESKKFLTASPNGLTLDRGMYNSALKGVFSKSSGDCIVWPNFCLLS